MKTLRRLFKRLTNWINWPTSRERMWWMYTIGKAQGRREALKELPIVQVQPKQTSTPPKQTTEQLHLPTGAWSHGWHELQKMGVHPTASRVLRRIGIQYVPPDWLNSKPPCKPELPETTEEMPAVVKLLHERKYATRKLG